ncbi:replication-associated protein RepA family protein, partial [Staphylococcus epidermidis]
MKSVKTEFEETHALYMRRQHRPQNNLFNY